MGSIAFELVDILGHSLGIDVPYARQSRKRSDKKLPNKFYRNRFCAGDYHSNLAELKTLEKMGYMAQGQKINEGRDTLWYVTDEGIKRFRECFEFIVNTHQNQKK